jgi:hypothetical protein
MIAPAASTVVPWQFTQLLTPAVVCFWWLFCFGAAALV